MRKREKKRLLQIFGEEPEKRRKVSGRKGKSSVLGCSVILCDKLKCQIVSGGQKTRVFCFDRIEVVPIQLKISKFLYLGKERASLVRKLHKRLLLCHQSEADTSANFIVLILKINI